MLSDSVSGLGAEHAAYLEEHGLVALCERGLEELLREREASHSSPLQYLAEWLMRHNPKQASPACNVVPCESSGHRSDGVRRDDGIRCDEVHGDAVSAGLATLQGARSYMEDRATVAVLAPGVVYAAVFDGHGGSSAAEYCASHLHLSIDASACGTAGADVEATLKAAFERANHGFLDATATPSHGNVSVDDALGGDVSGTTACVVVSVLEPSTGACVIHVAHVGDSRALLCGVSGSGSAEGSLSVEALTADHSPDSAAEAARIEAAGGEIFDAEDGCGGRVVGSDGVSMLQVSRSIGDRLFKCTSPPLVPCAPDTAHATVGAAERARAPPPFVLLASDGVWESMSEREAAQLVCMRLAARASVHEAAAALCDEALRRGSEDNLAAAVVTL